MEDLDHIKAEFATALDGGSTTPALWRCNVSWVRPDQPIYSLAGYLEAELLAELRLADVLFPIRAQIWEQWEFLDAHLIIDNDREMWAQWEA